MRASVGRNLLAAAGVNQVVEGKDFPDLFALMNRGIVDAVFGPDAIMQRFGAGDERLRLTPLEPVQELHAAAGPAMPDDAVQRIRAAYQQLVDSGVVAQLRKRHPGIFHDG
jgi:polar amino acid transport system substrate-binding protein